MIGFALLLAHLVGDYLTQNDWMALNKANKWPGRRPRTAFLTDGSPVKDEDGSLATKLLLWEQANAAWHRGHLTCTVHCLAYALATFLVLLPLVVFPWWFYLATFAVHWPIDRFGLARRSMDWTGQKKFAAGICSPWSVIVVDNTYHLLTFYVLALLAGVR